MKTKLSYLFLIPLFGLLAACDNSDNDNPSPTPTTPTTVFDVAAGNDNFDTLVAALRATGLDETLDNPNATFTVFAPTDAAFALLGEDAINALLEDPATLSSILLYHVVSSEVDSAAAIAAAGSTVTTANGADVGLSLSGNNLLVNTATVTTVDIQADNGVIHVIDAILQPPTEKGDAANNIVETAVAAGTFNTLVAAVQAAGLDSLLADESQTFTVFAPTDAAFAKIDEATLAAILADQNLLTALLTQHVVADAEISSVQAYAANGTSLTTASGAQVPVRINNKVLTVGGAAVSTADIYTSNGVIHVIDSVIVGDLTLPTTEKSIVDVASEAGSFNTLVAALEATGLDESLANLDGTFTVFAPTDAAFAELGESTINALLADPATLSNILLYHVIADAEILADQAINVANGENSLIDMANKDKAALSFNEGDLFINLAKVTSANVMAANGVIHVIDKVILPPAAATEPDVNIVETAISAGNFSMLVTALQAAGLDTVLADETKTFTVFAPTDAAFNNWELR
ncbi:MAG: fasciclin domain-containing protein [Cellvibrionaceae bacterium]|nr:fasciclin domain-containing protein [Cellvibrionaceae bacterium]